MLAVAGYYNGTHVELLEKANVKRNQRVIVTIMDEFIKPPKDESVQAMTRETPFARKQAAFSRLEAWRTKYGTADTDLDYKREVMGAIDEKYGTAD